MADTPRLARADVSESGALSSLATANGLTQLERLYLYSSRTIADGDLTPLLPMPRMHDLRMTNRRHHSHTVAQVQGHLAIQP